MKIALLSLAVMIGLVVSQEWSIYVAFGEVQAIVKANPGISIADCTAQCDEIYRLIDPSDNLLNDGECAYACQCVIAKNCTFPTGGPGGLGSPGGDGN